MHAVPDRIQLSVTNIEDFKVPQRPCAYGWMRDTVAGGLRQTGNRRASSGGDG